MLKLDSSQKNRVQRWSDDRNKLGRFDCLFSYGSYWFGSMERQYIQSMHLHFGNNSTSVGQNCGCCEVVAIHNIS